MIISFKNLGPLSECRVELANLTVITGHNNTGKTYVTYGMHGLLSGWRHWMRPPPLRDTAMDLLAKGNATLDLAQFTGASFQHQLATMGGNYQKNLDRVLAAEPKRFETTKVSIEFQERSEVVRGRVSLQAELPSGYKFALAKDEGETLLRVTRQGLPGADRQPTPSQDLLAHWLGNAVLDLAFQPYFPRIYIASSERTGAAIFQRELNLGRNRLIETLADLKPGEAPNPFLLLRRMASSYALPVQQNVEFLSPANLEPLQRLAGPLAEARPDLVEALEDVAGGTYRVTKEGAYFSPHRQRGVRLRLGECSSAVRSLLDITYYVRHVLRPGDFFVIDEPELNLHPKNQRKMARLIGRLVNAGVKVLLTTHSDYVIRELNSLILLAGRGSSKDRLLQQLGYQDEELVPASSVRFYRTTEALRKADHGIRKSRVPVLEEVPVTEAAGIAVESFDEEIEDLNRIQDSILYASDTEEFLQPAS